MHSSELSRAVAAASATASGLGLQVTDAIILQNSNKVALRLTPCDVMARVAPHGDRGAEFEVALARRLTELGSPVSALEPRVPQQVHRRDGFAITLWTYYDNVSDDISPTDYANALHRLHAAMRDVDIASPHFTERVASAQQLLDDHDRTPELALQDRTLLSNTLHHLGQDVAARGNEQLLHGEPHPGNLLNTSSGPVFIDLETCCRGPVEFDLAHAPDEVADHYPEVDQGLLNDCRKLVLAMITTWRWDRDDQLPDGRRLAEEWIAQLRAS